MTDRLRFWTWFAAGFNYLLNGVLWIGAAIKYLYKSTNAFLVSLIALAFGIWDQCYGLFLKITDLMSNKNDDYAVDTIIGVGQSDHLAIINQYILPLDFMLQALAFIISSTLAAFGIKAVYKAVKLFFG